MKRTTTSLFYLVLNCLMVGNITAMEDPDITVSLLPKQSNSESNEPLDKNSVAFRDTVDDLTNRFEGFFDLTPEDKEKRLKECKVLIDYCLTRQQLSNAGFRGRLEISEETTDKLTAITTIYNNHKKPGCQIQ